MFHPAYGNSYKLNSTSNKISTMLKEHKTKDEIIDELSSEYQIDKNILFIDVSDFISKMKIYGLM